MALKDKNQELSNRRVPPRIRGVVTSIEVTRGNTANNTAGWNLSPAAVCANRNVGSPYLLFTRGSVRARQYEDGNQPLLKHTDREVRQNYTCSASLLSSQSNNLIRF